MFSANWPTEMVRPWPISTSGLTQMSVIAIRSVKKIGGSQRWGRRRKRITAPVATIATMPPRLKIATVAAAGSHSIHMTGSGRRGFGAAE